MSGHRLVLGEEAGYRGQRDEKERQHRRRAQRAVAERVYQRRDGSREDAECGRRQGEDVDRLRRLVLLLHEPNALDEPCPGPKDRPDTGQTSITLSERE